MLLSNILQYFSSAVLHMNDYVYLPIVVEDKVRKQDTTMNSHYTEGGSLSLSLRCLATAESGGDTL